MDGMYDSGTKRISQKLTGNSAFTLCGVCTSIGTSLCCTVDHCSRTDSGGKDWKHYTHSETFYDLLWIPSLGHVTVADGLLCRADLCGVVDPISLFHNWLTRVVARWIRFVHHCGSGPYLWSVCPHAVGPISATQWLMICVARLIHAALLIGVPEWIHTVWPLCASFWIHTLLMCATGKPYCWASQRYNGPMLSFWSL